MLQKLKKLVPRKLVNQYHHVLAWLGVIWYGWPSNKLVVIGVTGTSGKSTTVLLIAKILEEAGFKVGYTSTIGFKIDKEEWLNEHKVTMLGWFFNQRLLKRMVKAGCQYAIIESASQGVLQYRQVGINYDVMVFTNLHEEHIEAHGGYENYKKAKGKLFEHLMRYKRKEIGKLGNWEIGNENTEYQIKNIEKITNNQSQIKKQIVVNLDDKEAGYFVGFEADEKFGYRVASSKKQDTISKKIPNPNNQIPKENVLEASDVESNNDGSRFLILNSIFFIHLFGEHNVYNALAAVSVCCALGVDLEICDRGLGKLKAIPGHMEEIENNKRFRVFVDYAFEPKALEKSYEVVKNLIHPQGKIIHVLGACGGGRDKNKRPVLGKMAAENADVVIVTNEDPYDDDPEEVIDQVIEGIIKNTNKLQISKSKFQINSKIQIPNSNKFVYKILNRREAIREALRLANEGDLVFITGKGCEQFICVANGKKIAWDDRVAVREELVKIG